ncbi:hypothetical protein ACFJGV_15270 [Cnuibacter sp. UC19_7]|uniref:hypothetical protein n=1 Tax=Cnuibacter sp. UC19_7 TaxID=3350166 RepID=UPI0036713BBC
MTDRERVRLPDGSRGVIADVNGANQLITIGDGRVLRPVLLDDGDLRWVDEGELEVE